MKKIITIAIIIVVIIFIFFIKTNYKLFKFGNNMSNKSADEIEKHILDINSYKAEASITVESNKSTNMYVVKEECIKESNIFKQEILEPENLKGILFIYDGNNLKIKNTQLSLNKIYEKYPYVGENTITLMDFINDYKDSSESTVVEKGEEIVLETKLKNSNKYTSYKKLCINKSTGKPAKLEIQDLAQKTVIYILYNEIEINNLQKDDILAFKLNEIANDI